MDSRDMWIDDINSARQRGEEFAAGKHPAPQVHRSHGAPQSPSQVYSIRIPMEHLARLRAVADERGEAPSALMRQWVIDRLDDESAVERTLAQALATPRRVADPRGGNADAAYRLTWPHTTHGKGDPHAERRKAG